MREEDERRQREEEARLKALEDARFSEETAQLDIIIVRQQELLSSWQEKRQEEIQVNNLEEIEFQIDIYTCHMLHRSLHHTYPTRCLGYLNSSPSCTTCIHMYDAIGTGINYL